MRRIVRNTPIVFFLFLSLVTVSSALLSSRGYEFIVRNRVTWFLLNLFIEAMLVSASIVKKKELTKAAVAFAQALPTLAVVYYFFTDSFLSNVTEAVIALHALLCFIACYVISLLNLNVRVFRVITTIWNTILLLITLGMVLLAMTFGSLGEPEVARELMSPNGSYVATIEKRDSGALGGATNVLVEDRTSSVDVGLGRFSKVRQFYSGEWYSHVTIGWKDDHTLLINGKLFPLTDASFVPES